MSFAREQLVRLLKIHNELIKNKYPTQEDLSIMCEVETRTIRRDLKLLKEDFDAPHEYSHQHRGYHYTRPFTLLPASFNDQELMALCLTLEVADSFHNTPFTNALKGAIAKVQFMQSSPAISNDLSSHISRIPDPMPPEECGAIIHFNQFIDAIAKSQQVRMTYYTIKNGKITTRDIDPYHLYFSYGMWYLYGYCHTRQEPREFAIHRIKKLELLSSTFTPPDRETIHTRLTSRFTNEEPITPEPPVVVKIHFTPEGARWIREREWHPTQTITDNKDGSIILTMKTAGITGIRRWLLGFAGRHATPLAPPALVKQVRDEIVAIAKNLERMNLI
jgi:predicted DNA-binding transcriptional regulator YafY